MLQTLTIGKTNQTQIEKLYAGNSKCKPHGASSIAKELGVPQRQVITHLQKRGLAKFSPGSYE